MKRDYILYLDYSPRRPLPRSRHRRPSWPPPAVKQGPYWVEPTAQGLRCVPRRGTYAYKRMVKRQQENEGTGLFVFFFFLFWLVFGLAAVVQCRS